MNKIFLFSINFLLLLSVSCFERTYAAQSSRASSVEDRRQNRSLVGPFHHNPEVDGLGSIGIQLQKLFFDQKEDAKSSDGEEQGPAKESGYGADISRSPSQFSGVSQEASYVSGGHRRSQDLTGFSVSGSAAASPAKSDRFMAGESDPRIFEDRDAKVVRVSFEEFFKRFQFSEVNQLKIVAVLKILTERFQANYKIFCRALDIYEMVIKEDLEKQYKNKTSRTPDQRDTYRKAKAYFIIIRGGIEADEETELLKNIVFFMFKDEQFMSQVFCDALRKVFNAIITADKALPAI